MDPRENARFRKWVAELLREGTLVDDLHRLIEQEARTVLMGALNAERKERLRADRAEVERDEALTKLVKLQEGVEALGV